MPPAFARAAARQKAEQVAVKLVVFSAGAEHLPQSMVDGTVLLFAGGK